MWSVFAIVTLLATGQVLYHEHSSDNLATRQECMAVIQQRGIELATMLKAHGIEDVEIDLSCEQLGTDL